MMTYIVTSRYIVLLYMCCRHVYNTISPAITGLFIIFTNYESRKSACFTNHTLRIFTYNVHTYIHKMFTTCFEFHYNSGIRYFCRRIQRTYTKCTTRFEFHIFTTVESLRYQNVTPSCNFTCDYMLQYVSKKSGS